MKKMSKLDIMNTMGDAADRKARMNTPTEDEEDPLNSSTPKAKKSPASIEGNQIKTIKNKNMGKGKTIPNTENKV